MRVMARRAWTDERMHDLDGKVDRLSESVDKRFDKVDAEFKDVRAEMKEGFQSLHNLIFRFGAGLFIALAAALAAAVVS